VAEGKKAVSSAVAQDPAEVGAVRESRPDRSMTEGVVPERGSVQQSEPERGRAGHALPGGILGVADCFRADDGSADPAAAAALSAFAAGTGSEHAALLALAATRLLVPVVAEVTPDAAGMTPDAAGVTPDAAASRPGPPAAAAAPLSAAPSASPAAGPSLSSAVPSLADGRARAGREPGIGAGEKSSDMALPTLIGRDGRRALPVFTSLESLARWQPSARPVPADAALVWRTAVEDSCAVVIDVAGPVPLAVEGARLTALAQGDPVPEPHEDPDVQSAVGAVITEALAGLPAPGVPAPDVPPTGALVGFALHPGVEGGDLLIELAVAPMIDAESLAARVGSAVLQRLGSRLCRGVALALSPDPGQPG
jgi:SseB protein N-terminal domain